MTAPTLKPTGQAAVQVELLARLGLPASASPEDVDQLHQAVSEFLAAAPSGIRGWARAQTAALDAAYLQLTDPVGLEGSALMSPASPPAVVPGGPATPPARRDPDPAAVTMEAPAVEPPAPEADDLAIDGEPTAEDLAALYAMVTPSAHDDMKPDTRRVQPAKVATAPRPVAAPAVTAAPPTTGSNIWKRIVIGAVGVAAVIAIGFGANALVGGAAAQPTEAPVAAGPTAPAVDMAKVAQLMERLQADPEDISALMDLGTEYYNGNDMATAGEWFDKVLGVDAKNVNALLARGAVYFNLGAFADAERTWLLVVDVEPDNVEAHYDLGFLYLNQSPPDWTGVQAEWNKVIELDPTSDLAATVKSHLESLAGASMLPGSSAAPSTAPGTSPAASPAAVAPGTVLSLGADNLAYDTASLAAPADSPFTIRFDNQDAGIPHDVQIRDAAGAIVFKGELVTGPATVDYQVPALAAGSYTFECSIHPDMTGTLVVGG